jgi:hypothetical protein
MEISNKALAWLVVAAIAVSLFGTIISLNKLNQGANAYASWTNDTGTTSVTISTLSTLRFALGNNILNFGTGQVKTNESYANCTLGINSSTAGAAVSQSPGCAGFNATMQNGTFIIENVGNTFLNVSINFSANQTWLEGSSRNNASFYYQVWENETGSCPGPVGTFNSTLNASWVTVPQPGNTTNACQNLSYLSATNSLRIGINITIPWDASGPKTVQIEAAGVGP